MRPHEENEQIQILFQALRDNSNELLFPQIIRILRNHGYSNAEILYYQRHGRHAPTMDIEAEYDEKLGAIQDEFDDMTRQMDDELAHMRHEFPMDLRTKKHLPTLVMMIVIVIILGVLGSLLIFSPSEEKTEPAPIEESTVTNGDKL